MWVGFNSRTFNKSDHVFIYIFFFFVSYCK
uniref:Uncharacterized protein n=1 Tax=Rhizophora mucronata TaxID=61149 RepID=A0A2P2R2J5_RHIMU